MKKKHFFITIALTLGIMISMGWVTSQAFAQEEVQEVQEEEVNTGQDFTDPLARFDIRQKYQDLPNGKSANMTTLRVDKPIVLKSGWILSLRADLPFISNDVVSLDNPNGDTEIGVSDFLNQVIIVAPQGDRNWTWAYGAQILWPTASQDQMGTGRFQIAPLVGAKVDHNNISPGSFSYYLLREHIDVGGNGSRGLQNYLVIQPGINIALPGHAFIGLAPEIRVNWENDNRWFVPFAVNFGKMINKSTVVSLDYRTPIHDDEYKVYDHEVEARVGFFF